MALDPKGGFEQIMSMARGFQVAKMLMVAVDLGLFDFLTEPKSAVETAAWLKAEPRATGIFLNGLAALGLVDKGGDKFKNSELATRYLVQGSENYRGAIIKHMEHTWKRGWEDLKDTVLVGHPPAGGPGKVGGRPPRAGRSRGPGLYLGHARHRPGPGPQGGGQAGSLRGAPPPGPGGRPGHLCH